MSGKNDLGDQFMVALVSGVILLFFGFLCTQLSPPQRVIVENPEEDPEEISERIESRLINYSGNFKSNLTPFKNLVEGYDGKYFRVHFLDLRSLRNNIIRAEKLFFEESEYSIDLFDEKFSTSLSSFVSTIDSLKKNRKVLVLVMGQADIKGNNGWSREINERYPYSKISVLPRIGEYLFEWTPKLVEIPAIIGNKHLPNLRGAFIYEMLRNYECDSYILDGQVTSRESFEDRSVFIYLFVGK